MWWCAPGPLLGDPGRPSPEQTRTMCQRVALVACVLRPSLPPWLRVAGAVTGRCTQRPRPGTGLYMHATRARRSPTATHRPQTEPEPERKRAAPEPERQEAQRLSPSPHPPTKIPSPTPAILICRSLARSLRPLVHRRDFEC
ncbi:hypothetical protein VPH35_039927 [Triticum aestivum]